MWFSFCQNNLKNYYAKGRTRQQENIIIIIIIILLFFLPKLPRNPEPKQRPSFSQISDYFCQAEDYLLSWTEKDLSAFVDCSLLGKNSSNSQHMFLDLQRRYGVI